MSVDHKINKTELITLFDKFVSRVVDGELDKEITQMLHEIINAVADNKPVYMQKGNDFNFLVNDFISCFYFDDINGGYTFEFEDIETSGKTIPVIR